MATNNQGNKRTTSANRSGGGNRGSNAGGSGGNRGNQGGRTRRARDSEGRFTTSWLDSARERPYATAAVAAGVAGVSAFLWSRRGQISELAETGMEKLSEFASDGLGSSQDSRSQRQISEEALSLKETGAGDDVSRQDRAEAIAY